jgi:hypothetical protein
MAEPGLQPRWAYLVGIIAVVVLWGGWFQAAPSGSEVPAPTIRVSTHLVLIDVVVTDKQGKAVSGLHPEDFVVEEKRQNSEDCLLHSVRRIPKTAGATTSAWHLFQ